MDIITAVFDRLSADLTLTAMLGTFKGAPCVFTDPLVPEKAPRPYVWISAPLRNRSWDTKLSRGRQVSFEIWCVVDNKGSTLVVDDIAERVLELLQRERLTLDSAQHVIVAEVEGPVGLDTDETVVGRKLTPTYRYL